jgi:predicted kinase
MMPAESTRPRLLLITGAPASGKTRLARELGTRYGCGSCSKDEFKEILFDVLGTGDAAWSRRLSDASFALLFNLAPRLLGTQELVLLEGNFRAVEHLAPLRTVLERSAAAAAQVLCVAAPATRAARLAQRAADPARHPGHRDPEFPVGAGETATFLELPGPRVCFNSEADWHAEVAACCTQLDRWLSPAKV